MVAGGVIALGAASPALAAAAAVGLAGYTGWQIGISAQRILGGFDPWTRCPIPGEDRIDEAAFWGGALLGGGAVGRLAGFRGPEYGRWKDGGAWQEGTHFHLGRRGTGLDEHHLPQQAGNWLRNLRGVMRRMLGG